MAESTFQQAILSDPLSEETRKERRYLLCISSLGIFMVKTGFIPTKITALGIEFSETDRNTLLKVIAAIIIYFLVAFVLYSLADYWSYRINVYLSQLTSLFNKYDSLVNSYLKELRDIRTELEEIKEVTDQTNREVLEVKQSARERTRNMEKRVQDLKVSAAAGSINVKDEKEKLLNQADELKKELTEKQAEFKEKKDSVIKELKLKKDRVDFLGAKADIDETKLFVPSAKVIAFFRLIFEYLTPVCVGVYAIFLLFSQ